MWCPHCKTGITNIDLLPHSADNLVYCPLCKKDMTQPSEKGPATWIVVVVLTIIVLAVTVILSVFVFGNVSPSSETGDKSRTNGGSAVAHARLD